MTTEPTTPAPRNTLVHELMATYPGHVRPEEVAALVHDALTAVRMFGTATEEMLARARRIADRDLRLRLGREREVARLGPESRRASEPDPCRRASAHRA